MLPSGSTAVHYISPTVNFNKTHAPALELMVRNKTMFTGRVFSACGSSCHTATVRRVAWKQNPEVPLQWRCFPEATRFAGLVLLGQLQVL